MTGSPSCWCGNPDLVAFHPGYVRCPTCETLVAAQMLGPEIAHVKDEETDLYGREYWFSHQEKHLAHPNILMRARSDMPERCLYWLQAVLRYQQPPARVLELGSGHGGFVAMLRWAGFDATGLEISPWVVEFARETFHVPMLLGPVEDQQIEPASLDVIALMDVLEHLHDPQSTMQHCLGLLKPDGILLIQTPCYPEGNTYEQMVARSERPLEILQPREHLYLFSRSSIRELFRRLGAYHIRFEPALFAQYDMFFVVSRAPKARSSSTDSGRALNAPATRMVQALLDLGSELEDLKQRYAESETDRALRLDVIDEQGRRLGEVEAARNNLAGELSVLRRSLELAEADRAERLRVIEEQGRQLGELDAARNSLAGELTALREVLEVAEADRAERLRVIEELGRRLTELDAARNNLGAELAVAEADRSTLRGLLEVAEADRAARLEVIQDQERRLECLTVEHENVQAEVQVQVEQIQMLLTQLRLLQQTFQAIQSSRAYRLLRKLGRWKFIEHIANESSRSSPASALRLK